MDKQDGYPPLPGPVPPPGWGYPPRRPTNSTAITALVVALVSFVTCPFIGAVAVYLGNRARAEIRSTGEEGDGMATAGVVVGWCALGLALLYVLFFLAYFVIFGAIIGSSAVG